MDRARRKRERRLEYLRQKGLAGWVPAAPVRERLRHLHDDLGITLIDITRRTGMDRETIGMQYRGVRKDGSPIRFAEMKTARAVLGARFTPEDIERFPVVGLRRRLQALTVMGYTSTFMARESGVNDYRYINQVKIGEKRVTNYMHRKGALAIIAMYDKYRYTPAEEAGVPGPSAARARTFARKRGYEHPDHWSTDTIDEPAAFPDTTGLCGTPHGWRAHKALGTDPCAPCLTAKAEREVRFSGDRFRALREKRGLSGQDVADALGVHNTVVYRWQLGTSSPKKNGLLERLLVLLDATYDDLFEEVDAR